VPTCPIYNAALVQPSDALLMIFDLSFPGSPLTWARSTIRCFQNFGEWRRLRHSARNESSDDRLRYRAEAAIRVHRGLTAELVCLISRADERPNTEVRSHLGDWLPCRLLIIRGGGVEEVWCALSTKTHDGEFVPEAVRDLLFAELERYLEPALFETRTDWPSGEIGWFEVVRLGLR
jgi:hypothetical protein